MATMLEEKLGRISQAAIALVPEPSLDPRVSWKFIFLAGF
jgi:hypothetical protein